MGVRSGRKVLFAHPRETLIGKRKYKMLRLVIPNILRLNILQAVAIKVFF